MVATGEGVILSKVGGGYRVFTNEEVLTASLRGRMKHVSSDHVVVGDRVAVHRMPDGTGTIEAVLPRRSSLRRRSPGHGRGERVVAANIDQVVVVGAARRPDWDGHLIDRFIAVAEANSLPVLLVINKSDLDHDPGSLAHPYRQAGYAVVRTSALTGEGLEELRSHLAGRESLVTGPTGVGKSSLLNALKPGLSLRIGTVSGRTQSGRHTTVAAEMHPIGEGSFVVDTPGLRDIGLWGLEPTEVAAAFPEFAAVSRRCRFDNCRHMEEPDCGVVEAVEGGEIAASRLASYRRLLQEVSQAARPWS